MDFLASLNLTCKQVLQRNGRGSLVRASCIIILLSTCVFSEWQNHVSLSQLEVMKLSLRTLSLTLSLAPYASSRSHLVSCCGARFCEPCIGRVKDASQPCPLCQEFVSLSFHLSQCWNCRSLSVARSVSIVFSLVSIFSNSFSSRSSIFFVKLSTITFVGRCGQMSCSCSAISLRGR